MKAVDRRCVALAVLLIAVASPSAAIDAEAMEATADARVAAIPRGSDTPSRGAALFAAQCARCHGDDARGDGPDAQFFVRPPRDLRSGVLDVYKDEELVARVRDGTPLRLELDPQAMRARSREVAALTAFLPRLPDIDWAKVEPGNEVYLDRCEICHGPFGRPAPGMPLPPGVQRTPRDLSSPEFQRSVSDRELLEIVRHGRSGMPAIPALQSGGDAELLVAYVRTLSPGRELYGTYCAGCHGEDGLGLGTTGVGPDLPDVRFDRDYFAHHDADELRRKVWHMLDREGPAMPHFARRLSADDATAIVVFLRGRGSAAPAPTATPH